MIITLALARRLSTRLAAGLLAFTALAGAGPAAAAEQVYCYDAARNSIAYVGREACRHEIVSPERAKQIQDARRDYIRRSMQQPPRSADQSKYRSFGSCFFVHPAGYAVTNHHVVAKCAGLSVLTAEGTELPARLVAVSRRADLALLRTDVRRRTFATISRDSLHPGAPITIIGFPVLKLPRREPMTMRGRFLGSRPLAGKGEIMAIDALVWQGSSGSPAFDGLGQVVGVVFAKANIPGIYERSGVVAEDRTYAVPADELERFLIHHGIAPATGSPPGAPDSAADALVRINCLR